MADGFIRESAQTSETGLLWFRFTLWANFGVEVHYIGMILSLHQRLVYNCKFRNIVHDF